MGDRSCATASVKLVVFDLDETLTLATFLPNDVNATAAKYATCVRLSFKSPWVEDRLQKLQDMCRQLTEGEAACKLAILTKNNRGARSVVQLLESAGLGKYFSAVWCLPVHCESACQEDSQWRFFVPEE